MIKTHTTPLVKIRCFWSACKWSCGLLYSLLNRYRLVSDWFRPVPGESYWLSLPGKTNTLQTWCALSFFLVFHWSEEFQSRSCPGTSYRCKILLWSPNMIEQIRHWSKHNVMLPDGAVMGQQLEWHNVTILMEDIHDLSVILMYLYSMFSNSVVPCNVQWW